MDCIATVCTSDYYQYYIPIFAKSALSVWGNADIIINVRGKLNSSVKEAMNLIDSKRVIIKEKYKTNYPYLVGTTNALRFVDDYCGYERVLVTDIDFCFMKMPQEIFGWYETVGDNGYYAGHHGPYNAPYRPSVCESWTGKYERIAGGFVVFYRPWWSKTKEVRQKYDSMLKNGEIGSYRETDEVILAKIVKEVGLPVAKKIPFPRFLRGLHFGDFKPEMKSRYTDIKKMKSLLDGRCIRGFLHYLDNDKVFKEIVAIVCRDTQINSIFNNVINYCNERIMENA